MKDERFFLLCFLLFSLLYKALSSFSRTWFTNVRILRLLMCIIVS